MPPAEKILKERISQEGPIPFRDFMEIALYHPEAGYYTSQMGQIGEAGDYYTSGSLGPLFGKMLARQFREVLEGMGVATVVEIGAGKGTLARDILEEWEKQEFHAKYFIVEKSKELQIVQREILKSYEVVWAMSVSDLPRIDGVIFSNELIDAFPVHAVEMTKEGLKEVFVDWRDGFVEVLEEPSTPALAEYFEVLDVDLPAGFRAEVNLAALAWLETVAARLNKGFLVTIDYGYPSHELYRDYRRHGTLMAYERHRATEDLYTNVGRRDLTAHVNFSALATWGEEFGLKVTGFTDQAHFLMSLGILEALSAQDTPEETKARLNAKSLLMPGGMGEMFKVLIQHKGLTPFPLSGLRFLPQRKSCRL